MNSPARQPPERAAVELAGAGEHHGLGGHVEPGRERLGREQHLDQALLEEQLDGLLQDRQQSRVVDADAAAQGREQTRET